MQYGGQNPPQRWAVLSSQGMAKSHAYGVSAVGADPKATSAQKSNMATASGALHEGSSRTLAIEWVCGSEAQPELRNPLLVMRAWLRFVDTADIPIASINKAWCKRYSDIKTRTVTETTHVWDSIASAMSASSHVGRCSTRMQAQINRKTPQYKCYHLMQAPIGYGHRGERIEVMY